MVEMVATEEVVEVNSLEVDVDGNLDDEKFHILASSIIFASLILHMI